MNEDLNSKKSIYQFLVILASIVIIIAGMKAAASIIIPFFLATFITIVFSPPFQWLQSKKVPKAIALLIVIFWFLIFIMIIGLLIGTSVNDFTTKIPFYEAKLRDQIHVVVAWLFEKGFTSEQIQISELLNPSAILNLIGNTLNELSGIFTNGFLILLIVIFMLLEVSSLPKKLNKIFSQPEKSIARVESIYQNINKYIAIKTWISLITGVLAGTLCAIVGVDYPILWGMLAFVLNYIPTIGSIIALIPPVLLTIVQIGPVEALLILVGYFVINTVMGNILEPKFMGIGLGLSTLVVFVSLIFWGWILGPIGMLLSVPLTIAIKIILDSSDETRWMAVLLGPAKID